MKILFENWRKFLEQVEDETPTKPKAIFMAGSPGSGKTTVIKGLGLKNKIPNIINSDDQYEADLKAAGLALNGKPAARTKFFQLKAELKEIDPNSQPDEYKAKEQEVADAKAPLSQYLRIFNKAQSQKKTSFKSFAEEGKSFVVDGTGGNYNSVAKDKRDLEALGYDVAMIYLELDLDTAKNRNQKRGKELGRQVVDDELEASHASVSKNKKPYESLFDNFFEINAGDKTMQSDIAKIKPMVDTFIEGRT